MFVACTPGENFGSGRMQASASKAGKDFTTENKAEVDMMLTSEACCYISVLVDVSNKNTFVTLLFLCI